MIPEGYTVEVVQDDSDELKDRIRVFERICFPDDESYYRKEYTRWYFLKNPEGKDVGYVGLDMCFVDNRLSFYLCRTGVLPEFEGRKLNRALVQYALLTAYEVGLPVITYVHPSNAGSLRSLMACGFEPYTPKQKFAGDNFVYLEWVP